MELTPSLQAISDIDVEATMWADMLRRYHFEDALEAVMKPLIKSHLRIPYNKTPEFLPGELETLTAYVETLKGGDSGQLPRSRKKNRRTPFATR